MIKKIFDRPDNTDEDDDFLKYTEEQKKKSCAI